MELLYKLKNGIEVLQNPQEIDICSGVIDFVFDTNGFLKVGDKTFKIENNKCSVNIDNFIRGTNPLHILKDNCSIPCQPIDIFDIKDRIKCRVATSLDVLSMINILQDKYIEVAQRVNELERANPKSTKDTLNDLIGAFNKLQDRVIELEKNYDPTLI